MAFDKNIVSTKKQTNILRLTLMSHLPRIPPYLPHHRPLSASRLKKIFGSMFWLPCHQHPHSHYFCLVWHLQYVSGFCYVCFYCRVLVDLSFLSFGEKKKHFHPVYAIKTFPMCCICPGSLFRKVLKSTWGCRALKSTLLISPQYPAPCMYSPQYTSRPSNVGSSDC